MDQNMIYMIAGAVVLLLVLIFLMLYLRKRNNKKPGKIRKKVKKQNFVSKYNGREATEKELDGVAKLELVNYKDGLNALVLRFEAKGGTVKIDDIEPYDNEWGFVHNYNEIIGQKRHANQPLRLFFNRREKKSLSYPDNFEINIVYRDDSGVKWLQPLRYNSGKGVKVKPTIVITAN